MLPISHARTAAMPEEEDRDPDTEGDTDGKYAELKLIELREMNDAPTKTGFAGWYVHFLLLNARFSKMFPFLLLIFIFRFGF